MSKMRCVKCLGAVFALCLCVTICVSLTSAKSPVRLPPANYFLVANYYNSETSLSYSLPQLARLISLLSQGDNVYLSIFENGSEDSTAAMLTDFARSVNVSHSVVTCNFTGSFIQSAATSQHKEDLDLGRIIGRKRYIRMATLRNLAMKPLYEGNVTLNSDLPTKVVFLNDVFFTAEQVVELLDTNHGRYDIACGLDFYDLFYDILVTRDINGDWFSGFFPYSRDTDTRSEIIAERPFRVFSCWNGIAVLRAEPFVQHGVRFRGRRFEDCECVQSECLLVCRDFRALGFRDVFVNPAVRVTYEWKHFLLYNTPVLSPLLQWAQYLAGAFVIATMPPASPGIGCGMPPYWTQEAPSYMQLVSSTCALPFDASRPLLNDSVRESQRERDFAVRYQSRFVEECL